MSDVGLAVARLLGERWMLWVSRRIVRRVEREGQALRKVVFAPLYG